MARTVPAVSRTIGFTASSAVTPISGKTTDVEAPATVRRVTSETT